MPVVFNIPFSILYHFMMTSAYSLRKGLALLALVATSFVFVSCDASDSDTETAPALQEQKISDLSAPNDVIDYATGQVSEVKPFVYFSLAQGKTVKETESWDIAFKGTTIRVNGGASGSGNAAAAVVKGLFDELKEIPADAVFAQDKSATELAIPTGSGKGWYLYSPTTHLITPEAGKLLLVRTAAGKYAKIEILSYYKGAPATPTGKEEAACYTFRYVHQPDGSKKF